MKASSFASLAVASAGAVSGAGVTERQSCPSVYVFGARETTASPGYGTAGGLVNMVVAANPGAGSSAITYPACGGQSTCGGISYDDSANQGTAAVVSAVTSYNQQCPSTKIVLIGYSQGGQIMDNAFCGGAGATLSGTALAAVKAVIFMGDPHNVAGLPYNVGTCTAGGFAARPAGFQCSPGNSAIIKSYCDAADPYCCNGADAATHQGYVTEYGSQALAFIQSLLGSVSSLSLTLEATSLKTPFSWTNSTPTSGSGAAQYGQCGGIGWTGPTTCSSPYTCKVINSYYSQCV
ncbi:carbohydrate-binding module family 1 protein [Xylariaceae sp. FL1019]|nr:carbohydrate-binding module family 1 protein [Xylariaceae sp. FL1019]